LSDDGNRETRYRAQGTDHRQKLEQRTTVAENYAGFVIDEGAFSFAKHREPIYFKIVREHANRSAVEAVYASICALCAACSSSGSEGQRSPEFAHPPPVAIEVCTRERCGFGCAAGRTLTARKRSAILGLGSRFRSLPRREFAGIISSVMYLDHRTA
jgi:hypothetical protein